MIDINKPYTVVKIDNLENLWVAIREMAPDEWYADAMDAMSDANVAYPAGAPQIEIPVKDIDGEIRTFHVTEMVCDRSTDHRATYLIERRAS
jgi:hypothetical protein